MGEVVAFFLKIIASILGFAMFVLCVMLWNKIENDVLYKLREKYDLSKACYTKRLRNRECVICKHHHKESCPNSSKCYDTENKPYFEEKVNYE